MVANGCTPRQSEVTSSVFCGQMPLESRYTSLYFRISVVIATTNHWPSQEAKLEVPTIYIYKAYVRANFQGISPQNMARKMVLAYLHFRILKFPLN